MRSRITFDRVRRPLHGLALAVEQAAAIHYCRLLLLHHASLGHLGHLEQLIVRPLPLLVRGLHDQGALPAHGSARGRGARAAQEARARGRRVGLVHGALAAGTQVAAALPRAVLVGVALDYSVSE